MKQANYATDKRRERLLIAKSHATEKSLLVRCFSLKLSKFIDKLSVPIPIPIKKKKRFRMGTLGPVFQLGFEKAVKHSIASQAVAALRNIKRNKSLI